ncbi:MAG: DUF4115 domain-containing protein [Rhodobacteraceae bacterium]|nr:DUF4115 domain-containing protein [Paracoccaceae bacterium]
MMVRAGGPSHPHGRKLKGFDDYEFTLGDLMRGERATQGKSLLDVQRETKIKAEYLAGIEDADLSVFETPGFISGYVRTYARYLGMDPDNVFAQFCRESGFSHISGIEARIQTRTPVKARQASATASASHTNAPLTKRGTVSDAVLARSPLSAAPSTGFFEGIEAGAVASIFVLAGLVAGLGYGAWTVLQEIQRVTTAPVETPLTVASTDEPSLETAGLGVDNSAPSEAALERLYRPQALETPVMVPRDGPIATLDPGAQGAFAAYVPTGAVPMAPPPDAIEAAVAAAMAPAEIDLAAAEGDTPLVVAGPQPELALFARQPCWVRVRAADGTVLLEKILEKGERYVLPESETPPSLRAGNAGSLYFVVNGKALGPAGPGASVVKDVELSAESLQASYTTPDLTTDPDLASLAALVLTPDVSPLHH